MADAAFAIRFETGGTGTMIRDRRVVALVPIKLLKAERHRELCGRPLYRFILDALQTAYAVDAIAVDTDDTTVATDVRSRYRKVQVIDRPPELRQESVDLNLILEHDLSRVDADIYLQTHVTHPLLRSATIATCLAQFVESEELHDSLFTVTRHQKRYYFEDGRPVNHDPARLAPTDSIPALLEENSALYVFTRESFLRNHRRIGATPLMMEIPETESISIKDELTYRIAELLALHATGDHKD